MAGLARVLRRNKVLAFLRTEKKASSQKHRKKSKRGSASKKNCNMEIKGSTSVSAAIPSLGSSPQKTAKRIRKVSTALAAFPGSEMGVLAAKGKHMSNPKLLVPSKSSKLLLAPADTNLSLAALAQVAGDWNKDHKASVERVHINTIDWNCEQLGDEGVLHLARVRYTQLKHPLK